MIETSEKDIAEKQTADDPAGRCPDLPRVPAGTPGRSETPGPRAAKHRPRPQGPWSQTFELLRNQEAVWGNEVYGLPLGSPVFCCYYRADLLECCIASRPRLGKNMRSLARLLREEGAKPGGLKSGGVKYGTVEPLARGWAGLVLLARAAAYCQGAR